MVWERRNISERRFWHPASRGGDRMQHKIVGCSLKASGLGYLRLIPGDSDGDKEPIVLHQLGEAAIVVATAIAKTLGAWPKTEGWHENNVRNERSIACGLKHPEGAFAQAVARHPTMKL